MNPPDGTGDGGQMGSQMNQEDEKKTAGGDGTTMTPGGQIGEAGGPIGDQVTTTTTSGHHMMTGSGGMGEKSGAEEGVGAAAAAGEGGSGRRTGTLTVQRSVY